MANDQVNLEEWYAANIENWYEDIYPSTFRTTIVPLDKQDALAIVGVFEGNTPKENDKIAGFEEKLEKALELYKDTGAFVKFSCRSPKDVTATSEKMKSYFNTKISQIENPTDNDIVCSLFESHIKVLKVSNAKEALELFLPSARIYEDLKMGLQQEKFNINAIVREWQEIEIRHEFRGFVFGKTLTALSQYFDFCYFPQLKDEMPHILPEIHNTFETIKEKVKLSNFICDFGVSVQKDKNGQNQYKVFVIELNPWLDTTDSCLFSWMKDRALGPFQFRSNQKPVGGVKGQVISVWKPYFEKKKKV